MNALPPEADVQVGETPEPRVKQAILTLTEKPEGPGFTLGYAFSMDDQDATISQVDIVLIALMNFVRNTPPSFKRELDRVNSAVADLTKTLADENGDFTAAIETFRQKTGITIAGAAANAG